MIVLGPQETHCKLPIKLWTPTPDDFGHDWDAVYQQLRNLANHPLARKWVCAMPDFHVGYGMPIGGVMATKGGVIPNAVGVDIGCGMVAMRTDIDAYMLPRSHLEDLQAEIYRRVPTGFKHQAEPRVLAERLTASFLDTRPDYVVAEQYENARTQIGTLGGGNHFIELQRCQEDDRLWVMIHSGSRNVGKRVCDHYNKIAKQYMNDFASAVPDLDLSFLPTSAPEYDSYMAEMRWCMAFAESNRLVMLEAVSDAFLAALGHRPAFDHRIETHHNFAAMENHGGENLLIHRKGAVKSPFGTAVIIPGSMGTASFIGTGMGSTDSYNSCSHGAGRVMGRKAANRDITHDEAVAAMAHVVYDVRDGEYDESPLCYKPIDDVMEAQADLVTPRYRLWPLMVVKG